jgi:hypothetical protein
MEQAVYRLAQPLHLQRLEALTGHGLGLGIPDHEVVSPSYLSLH